jgi:alpha-1,6-mannosyltransferase
MSSDISAAGKIPAPPLAADAASPLTADVASLADAMPTTVTAKVKSNARTAGSRNAAPLRPAQRPTRGLRWLAWTGIGTAIVIMVAVSLVRGGWMRPPLAIPAGGPPWQLPVRQVSADVVTYLLWFAAVASAAGVASGLLAIRRGGRLNARLLLIVGLITVAVLTVLPPAGSTDSLDYATYGRLLLLGHSPYVYTPHYLRHLHDAFAQSIPVIWSRYVSVYGPLATMEQFLAAKLGGSSPALIVFWLKLWNSAGFAAVAVALHRLLRAHPAQRLRAHLLWTLNPLLLWDLVEAGHLDVLAAAAGLFGLLVLGRQAPGERPALTRVLASGVLLGVAADLKINYALFGLGAAWALRRYPAALAAAGAAALAVLVPSYAWFGMPAVKALLARRNQASADNFYRLFLSTHHFPGFIAAILVIAMAVLAMRRFPPGDPARPAIRPTVALAASWLFLWPYQLPWYDAMIICVLVLYPATRLDWLVLARLTAGTIANMPGNPLLPHGHVLNLLDHYAIHVVAPLVILGAAVGLVALCWSGRWNPPDPDRPPPAPPAAPDADDRLVPAAG